MQLLVLGGERSTPGPGEVRARRQLGWYPEGMETLLGLNHSTWMQMVRYIWEEFLELLYFVG